MFTSLAPERAGCNAKITLYETNQLQIVAFGEAARQGDFSAIDLPGFGVLVSSIDKIGRFCDDLTIFAEVALCHALRDIAAGLAVARSVDVCFEFGLDLANETARAKLVEAVTSACRKYGVGLGKCHSVFAQITSLTIAANGVRTKEQEVPEMVDRGLVLLANPLGAFREIYFAEQGHNAPHAAWAIGAMTFDYEGIIHAIRPSVLDAADVSGFGLSGALASLADRKQVHMDIRLPLEALVGDIRERITCLQADTPSHFTIADEGLEIALTNREVAGPLVFLVSLSSEEVVLTLEKSGLRPFVLGQFHKGTPKVEVAWA